MWTGPPAQQMGNDERQNYQAAVDFGTGRQTGGDP